MMRGLYRPRVVGGWLSLIAVLLSLGCTREHEILPSGETLFIGVIAPLSGPDVELGQSGLQGVELSLELQPMLSNGDAVKLLVQDDQSLPDKSVEALDHLASQGVVGVLVLSQSSSALALADRAKQHQIPILATIATHPDLTTKNPHLVQLSFDDAFQAVVAALYLRDELLLARAAVFSQPEDPHSKVLAEEFMAQFLTANGQIVDHVELSGTSLPDEDTFRALRKEGVEILYLPVRAEHLLRIAETLKSIGWKPVVMSSDGLLSEMILKHEEDLNLVQGFLATDIHSSLLARTSYGDKVSELYLNQEYKMGSTFTLLGSEGASMLLNAIDRCGRPYAPRRLQQCLLKTNQFEGFSGLLSISRSGQAIRPVYVNTIDGRELRYVVKVY